MKQLKVLKQPRTLADLRVTRKSNVSLEHKGEGHGWAVSYADLLMVLLSFFVLYFNFDDSPAQSRDDQFRQLTLSMKGMTATTSPSVGGDAGAAGGVATGGSLAGSVAAGEGKNSLPTTQNTVSPKPTTQAEAEAITSIAGVLKFDGANVTQVEDRLILAFDKTTFKKGDYQMRKELREQVDSVLVRLRPFTSQIEITVIGHSDRVPLRWRNEYLQDNFDLSSLRALGVLKYMKAKGFPENKASARAASSFDRNARSVSLEIRLAKKKEGVGS